MKIQLWIIYKSGIGFSKFIAERIQDHLEDFIDVYVGSANMIDPKFIIEEKFDYLIIGDVINETRPSLEIQNWLLKYWEISNKKQRILKAISGFYVALTDVKVEPFWVEFFHDNVKAEIIFPPILSLKLSRAELTLENGAPELVKAYSNDFIEFFLRNK